MKSMNDIKHDMSELYDEVRSGRTELKTAAELANIAGKFLKAEQLLLARDIFVGNRPDVNMITLSHERVNNSIAN